MPKKKVAGGFRKKLGKMEEMWENAQKSPAFKLFPAGQHRFKVVSAELEDKSDGSGNKQVHWEYVCTAGKEEGESLHQYSQMATEQNLSFLFMNVRALGFEVPSKFSELEETLAEIIEAGPEFTGNVRHKDGFANLRITRLLSDGGFVGEDEDDDEDKGGTEPEGDEPTKEELAALCVTHKVKIKKSWDRDRLVKEIVDGYRWSKDNCTPEEVEILEAVGAEVV